MSSTKDPYRKTGAQVTSTPEVPLALPEPASDVLRVCPDAGAVAAWKASHVVLEPSEIVNNCPFCACTVAPFLKVWDAEKMRTFDPDVMLTVPAPATRSRIVFAAMVCSPSLLTR